jgi:ribonuclease-3
LADTLEAVAGAVFLDGGFDAAKSSLRKLYSVILAQVDPKTLGKDDKTLLQEYLQGFQMPLPSYTVTATTGAAHNQQFEVECVIQSLKIKVKGFGASRRAAEQGAAKLALLAITKALPQEARKPKKTRSAKKKAAKSDTAEEQLNLKLKA